jgi:hypothetical protein
MASSSVIKERKLVVIISEEIVFERLAFVSSDKAHLSSHILKNDREVETVVTRLLIKGDTD